MTVDVTEFVINENSHSLYDNLVESAVDNIGNETFSLFFLFCFLFCSQITQSNNFKFALDKAAIGHYNTKHKYIYVIYENKDDLIDQKTGNYNTCQVFNFQFYFYIRRYTAK